MYLGYQSWENKKNPAGRKGTYELGNGHTTYPYIRTHTRFFSQKQVMYARNNRFFVYERHHIFWRFAAGTGAKLATNDICTVPTHTALEVIERESNDNTAHL